MIKFKKIFIHSWLRYLLSFLFTVLVIVTYNITKGWDKMIYYIDALFIAGFALICISGLSIVNYFGAFDIFTHLFAKPNENNKKPSFYEYSLEKSASRKEHRFNFVPYAVIGFLSIILSIILFYI